MERRFVATRRFLPVLREVVSGFRSFWFDLVHGVTTRSTKADKPCAERDNSRGFWYLPTWPKAAESALRDLPITDYSSYTFVDFGSGKGRILLLAAALPFRKVVGVEISADLHEQANRNLACYKRINVLCRDVKSLQMDALDFQLPDENLVLYFFNPFGEEVMEKLRNKLESSLEAKPRDIIAIFVHPEYAYVFDRSRFFVQYEATETCYKYRTRNGTKN